MDRKEFIAKIDGSFEEKLKEAYMTGWDNAIDIGCRSPYSPGKSECYANWKNNSSEEMTDEIHVS